MTITLKSSLIKNILVIYNFLGLLNAIKFDYGYTENRLRMKKASQFKFVIAKLDCTKKVYFSNKRNLFF